MTSLNSNAVSEDGQREIDDVTNSNAVSEDGQREIDDVTQL